MLYMNPWQMCNLPSHSKPPLFFINGLLLRKQILHFNYTYNFLINVIFDTSYPELVLDIFV